MPERVGGRPKMARTKVSAHYTDESLAVLDRLVELHPRTKRADAIRAIVDAGVVNDQVLADAETELAALSARYGGRRNWPPYPPATAGADPDPETTL